MRCQSRKSSAVTPPCASSLTSTPVENEGPLPQRIDRADARVVGELGDEGAQQRGHLQVERVVRLGTVHPQPGDRPSRSRTIVATHAPYPRRGSTSCLPRAHGRWAGGVGADLHARPAIVSAAQAIGYPLIQSRATAGRNREHRSDHRNRRWRSPRSAAASPSWPRAVSRRRNEERREQAGELRQQARSRSLQAEGARAAADEQAAGARRAQAEADERAAQARARRADAERRAAEAERLTRVRPRPS